MSDLLEAFIKIRPVAEGPCYADECITNGQIVNYNELEIARRKAKELAKGLHLVSSEARRGYDDDEYSVAVPSWTGIALLIERVRQHYASTLINGLTEAETNATASVAGLTQSAPVAEDISWKNSNGMISDADLPDWCLTKKGKKAEKTCAPLSDTQLEKIWEDTFSTNNPFCPCNLKTFLKVTRAVEQAHKIGAKP